MKGFTKKRLAVLAALALALVLATVLLLPSGGETPLLRLDRTVEFLYFEEDRVYLTVAEDSLDYVYYAFDDLPADVLRPLSVGDKVTLSVEAEGYGAYQYTVLWKVEKNGTLLLDASVRNREQGLVQSLILLAVIDWALLGALLTVLLRRPRNNSARDFLLCNPLWHRVVYVAGIAGSLAGTAMLLILHVCGLLEKSSFGFLYVFLIFLGLCSLGLSVDLRERFQLREEVYSHRPFLGKTKSVALSDLGFVSLSRKKWTLSVIFSGKDGGELLRLSDVNRIFRQGWFLKSLDEYKIPNEFTRPPYKEAVAKVNRLLDRYGKVTLQIQWQGETCSLCLTAAESTFGPADGEPAETFASPEQCLSAPLFGGRTLEEVWFEVERSEWVL